MITQNIQWTPFIDPGIVFGLDILTGSARDWTEIRQRLSYHQGSNHNRHVIPIQNHCQERLLLIHIINVMKHKNPISQNIYQLIDHECITYHYREVQKYADHTSARLYECLIIIFFFFFVFFWFFSFFVYYYYYFFFFQIKIFFYQCFK